MIFPLLSQDKGKLSNISGVASNFIELQCPDLELMSESECVRYRENWIKAVGSHDGPMKFYFVGNKAFLNTKSEFKFLGLGGRSPHSPPLFSAFGIWDNAGPSIYEDYFILGGWHYKILKLITLPQNVDFLALRKIDHYMAQLEVMKEKEANFHLEFRRRSNFSKILTGLKNLKAGHEFEEMESILSSVKKGEEKIVRIDCLVLLKARNQSDLITQAQKFVEKWQVLGWGFEVVSFNVQKELNHFIPGIFINSYSRAFAPLTAAINFLSLSSDHLHESGVSFVTPLKARVCFEIFNQSSLNFNVLITGPSGQGKSMLASKIIKHNVEQGCKAMILDLGGSFRRLNRYLDGSERGMQFHPFESLRPQYLLEFVLAVWGNQTLNNQQRGRLLKLIKLWAISNRPKEIDSLLACLEKGAPGISDSFEEIRPYLSNEVTKSDVSLIYVDFQNVPSVIKRAYLIYLFEAFSQWKGKRILLIDECWDLLTHHADFISECFRTFRKHQASAVAIGQGLGDFLHSTLGQVIFENSYTKILFHQVGNRPAGINQQCWQRVEKVGGVKDVYSEFVVMQDERSKTLRFYPLPIEKCLFNTSAEEVQHLSQFLEAHEKSFGFKKSCHLFSSLYFGHRAFSDQELQLLGARYGADGGVGIHNRATA